MRMANEAMECVPYPIPTVDEILQGFDSIKFLKLDRKWGYHQIELDIKTCENTTIATDAGLYRSKALLFRVNFTTEQY